MRKLLPLMFSLAIVAGCSDDDDPVTPVGALGVAAGQATATVAAGGSITIPISVSRSGSFNGPITLTAENLPTGVTASFDPSTVAAGNTTSDLTITAAASAPASAASNISVRASGSGVTSKTAAISLTVTTAGITLVTGASTATVTQGATASIPVSFTREGAFSGAVAIEVEGLPTGVTAAVTPTSVAANSNVATVTLTADAAATTGTSNITIRGSGTGIASQTQTVALTVNPSTTTGLSLTLAPAALIMQAGQTSQTSVTVARTGGFAGDVALTLEDAPAGMTITVNPATVDGNMATVTVATTAAVAAGVYQVHLRGTSGATNALVPLTVIVTAAP